MFSERSNGSVRRPYSNVHDVNKRVIKLHVIKIDNLYGCTDVPGVKHTNHWFGTRRDALYARARHSGNPAYKSFPGYQ